MVIVERTTWKGEGVNELLYNGEIGKETKINLTQD